MNRGYFFTSVFFFSRKKAVIDVSEIVDSLVQYILCTSGDACEYMHCSHLMKISKHCDFKVYKWN